MIGEIVSMAKAFYGRAPEAEQETLLTRLCEEAFIQWGNRLKSGLTAEDCPAAMIPACAWTALAGFVGGQAGSGSWTSFRAGEVSVSGGGQGGQTASLALREQAERIMAPYVEDEGFVFQGVRG